MEVKNHHIIGSAALAIATAFMTGSIVLPTQAANDETATAETIFPALYEVAHLEAAEGSNEESVLGHISDVTGYFAYTTNDAGVELWVAEDNTALSWQRSDENPLAEYHCQRVGRHTLAFFNDSTYFAASCEAGNFIFRQTGLTTAEIVHTNEIPSLEQPAPTVDDQLDPPPGDDGNQIPGEGNEQQSPGAGAGGYPTAGIVGTGDNQQLVMFANDALSMSADGDTWVDYATSLQNALPGMPSGVPLEASPADANGVIYLAYTSGEVVTFDGEQFVSIGTDYLESITEPGNQDMNLPAVSVFNDIVYVGNQDSTNGASIFAYSITDENPTWEELVQLDKADTIVNKMGLSQFFGDDRQYLVFYTSNGEFGTRVMSLNSDGELQQLLPDGLGGGANEREVVSVANKTVTDNGIKKKVLLFGTQNQVDQSRIYVMQLDENIPVEPSSETTIISEPTSLVAMLFGKTKKTSAFGKPFQLQLDSSSITKGDRLTLYINGNVVQQLKVKDVSNTVLTYKGAKKLKAGTIFRVAVGRRPAYGSGAEQLLSNNTVTSSAMKVKIVK